MISQLTLKVFANDTKMVFTGQGQDIKTIENLINEIPVTSMNNISIKKLLQLNFKISTNDIFLNLSLV